MLAASISRDFIKRARPFVLVLARDAIGVPGKLEELKRTNIPFVIVCGERGKQASNPGVRYRKPVGKWDAINFGMQFIPQETELVLLNDVDTRIHFLEHALSRSTQADLVYCKVRVDEGPQRKFYKILDPLRQRIPMAASGELMLIKRKILASLTPIPPCTAEDTYLMFKAMETGYHVEFCTKTYVTTVRTRDASEEEIYKTRTTLGIYQALSLVRAPPLARVFYYFLPVMAPLLALMGADGRAWAKGIEQAAVNHLTKRYSMKF